MGEQREQHKDILFMSATTESAQIDAAAFKAAIDKLHADKPKDLNNWNTFFDQLEINGLAPLFAKHCRYHQIDLPNDKLAILKSLVLRHKAITSARYIALEEFSVAMRQAEIEWYALKGLALAQILYDGEYLRPMRDFDILVPKEQLKRVALIMQRLGYYLPTEQPSKFMRNSHQLPNAEKQVNGFKISIEIHHDAISRDAKGSLEFGDIVGHETIEWRGLTFKTLAPTQMLHQVSRHMEAVHPGGNLKLINVVDVVAYANKFYDKIDWNTVKKQHPHILSSLTCLHLISPVPIKVQNLLVSHNLLPIHRNIMGVGQIMLPIKMILRSKSSIKRKLSELMFPSDWWLHLYYQVPPNQSLWLVKSIFHPFSLLKWAVTRAYSFIRGG